MGMVGAATVSVRKVSRGICGAIGRLRCVQQQTQLCTLLHTSSRELQNENTPVDFLRIYLAAPSVCKFDLPRSDPQGYGIVIGQFCPETQSPRGI